MDITITFGAWMIPTVITAIAIFWAMFIVESGSGFMSGLSNIIALVPALFVSMISWVIYALCK